MVTNTLQQFTLPLQFTTIHLQYIYNLEKGQNQTCQIFAFWFNNISSVRIRITLKFRGHWYDTKSKWTAQVQQSIPFAVKVLGTSLFSTFLTVFSIIIVWTRTCVIASVSSLFYLIIMVQRFLKWQVGLQQCVQWPLHPERRCHQYELFVEFRFTYMADAKYNSQRYVHRCFKLNIECRIPQVSTVERLEPR